MQLLQYTATLLGGRRLFNSCNTLPHRLAAVGSGNSAMRGPTSYGDGDSFAGGRRCLKTDFVQCTASLRGGSGQCNSRNALRHSLPGHSGQCNSGRDMAQSGLQEKEATTAPTLEAHLRRCGKTVHHAYVTLEWPNHTRQVGSATGPLRWSSNPLACRRQKQNKRPRKVRKFGDVQPFLWTGLKKCL